MTRAVPVTSMSEQETIHVADVSEGIGGDATALFGLFQPPEEYVKSHDQYPA
jgi:hypothetical protein